MKTEVLVDRQEQLDDQIEKVSDKSEPVQPRSSLSIVDRIDALTAAVESIKSKLSSNERQKELNISNEISAVISRIDRIENSSSVPKISNLPIKPRTEFNREAPSVTIEDVRRMNSRIMELELMVADLNSRLESVSQSNGISIIGEGDIIVSGNLDDTEWRIKSEYPWWRESFRAVELNNYTSGSNPQIRIYLGRFRYQGHGTMIAPDPASYPDGYIDLTVSAGDSTNPMWIYVQHKVGESVSTIEIITGSEPTSSPGLWKIPIYAVYKGTETNPQVHILWDFRKDIVIGAPLTS